MPGMDQLRPEREFLPGVLSRHKSHHVLRRNHRDNQSAAFLPPLLCIFAVLVGSIIIVTDISGDVSAHTPHDPIHIDGNGDFNEANGVTRGSGTLDDPYILEGWEINAGFVNGVEIRNTTAYFAISDLYVHHSSISGTAGVYFSNVQNGKVINTTLFSNVNGAHIDSSLNVTIKTSNVTSNYQLGIEIQECENITIESNTISANGFGGSSLENSRNVFFLNNTFADNGISIAGDVVGHFDSHEIPQSNLVNGRPIFYFRDARDVILEDESIGQLILANCTLFNVSNMTVRNTDIGIQLGFSSNNTLSHNTLVENMMGVELLFSDGNEMRFNNISHSLPSSLRGAAVYLAHSHNNTIAFNELLENGLDGIRMDYSDGNAVLSNNLVANFMPIRIFHCNHSVVASNNITDNLFGTRLLFSRYSDFRLNTVSNRNDGLFLRQSPLNTIKGNDFSSHGSTAISLYEYSRSNVISLNNITDNGAGIRIIGSFGNEIFHNNIINNTVQAYDDEAEFPSKWDDGYPSGGNYWSDLEGPDDFQGPNQDVPGSDGIVDMPYWIGVLSRDRYPLVRPIGLEIPAPPSHFQARLSGLSNSNVTLTWSLSFDDGKGLKNVLRYELFRNTTYDQSGFGYEYIGFVANGTSEYVDALVGEGNPKTYFYRVCAVNSTNGSTCAGNQAAKFTRPLAPGPNLISIPLIQSNDSIEIVLQTVEYDKAWYYDTSSQEWIWCMKSKTYRRGLWNMDHTDGMWVNITGDCNLTVAGVVPAQTAIHLYKGWNLVSFPSFNTSYSVSDLKGEIGAIRVEGHDLAPPNFLRVLEDFEVLQTGYAYWVKVEAVTDWIVEVS